MTDAVFLEFRTDIESLRLALVDVVFPSLFREVGAGDKMRYRASGVDGLCLDIHIVWELTDRRAVLFVSPSSGVTVSTSILEQSTMVESPLSTAPPAGSVRQFALPEAGAAWDDRLPKIAISSEAPLGIVYGPQKESKVRATSGRTIWFQVQSARDTFLSVLVADGELSLELPSGQLSGPFSEGESGTTQARVT